MKKFTLMALVILLGTSCQVYKRSHAGGYTFKWKSSEKKIPKTQREKSDFEQIASYEEFTSVEQTKSFVNDDVLIENGERVSPVLEYGEALRLPAAIHSNFSTEATDEDVKTSKNSEIILQEFIDLFAFLNLIPDSPENTKSLTSAPMASNSSGWESILGFVLSLVGLILMFTPLGILGLVFVVAGMIFSIIDLGTGVNRGLAIAGIIISAIALFILLLAILLFAALIAAI